jgi:Protein of unknown function (DUF664)
MDPRLPSKRAYDRSIGFPEGNGDERELLLSWLDFLRAAVLRKADGLDDESARWTPEGRLLPLAGIVNHLTNAEERWIDGRMHGRVLVKDEAEYHPPPSVPFAELVDGYRRRAAATNATVRAFSSLCAPCHYGEGTDLRWALLHLIHATARHAGHADATRELLDGVTGE